MTLISYGCSWLSFYIRLERRGVGWQEVKERTNRQLEFNQYVKPISRAPFPTGWVPSGRMAHGLVTLLAGIVSAGGVTDRDNYLLRGMLSTEQNEEQCTIFIFNELFPPR